MPVDVQLLQDHSLKSLSFLHWLVLAPLSKISWACWCASIFDFSILFHWPMCISLHWCHPALITVALKYVLKSDRLIPPSLFIFLKIVLAILVPVPYNINFKKILYIQEKSKKYLAGILIEIALNLYTNLWRIDIFTMLDLLVHEHITSLHLFSSALISFTGI